MTDSIYFISWLNRLNFGGVERRAHELATKISRIDKYNVTLLCANTLFPKKYPHSKSFAEKNIYLPLNPYRFGLKERWEVYFLNKAAKKIEKDNISLVHGQGVNGLPGIRNNIPTVVCWHGKGRDLNKGGVLSEYWRETAENCDKILADSNRVKRGLGEIGIEKNKIEVIYNGVNVKEIEQADSKKAINLFKLDKSKNYILSVQNLIDKKRTKSLLDIFYKIQKKYGHYELLIAGTGPNYEVLYNYIRKKGINAKLLGHQENTILYSLYNLSDIFVLNSVKESLPLVYFEAMGAGLPICASNSGSVGEILKHGKNALLNKEYDDEQFYTNLLAVIEDRDLRSKLSSTAKKDSRVFDWGKIAEKVQSVYEELI